MKHSEETLYHGCLHHDDALRRATFDAYANWMYGVCLRYASDKEDARDMVQEGFIKVFSKIDSFAWKGPGSFTAWIRQIMVNQSIAFCRMKKKKALLRMQDDDFCDEDAATDADDCSNAEIGIEQALEAGLSNEELMAALAQLPDEFRIVFNLFAIDGLKHKEIAEALGIPIKTSTTRVMRAKLKLKKILTEVLAQKLKTAPL